MDMYTQIDDPTPGGFIQDLSGKGNHARVDGSPKFLHHDTGFMNALEFSQEDHLTVQYSESLKITKQITIESWAQTTDDRAGYVLFKPYDYGSPKFKGQNNVFSCLYFEGMGGLGYPEFTVNQPEATDGKWHYFALTYDGKAMRYYLDGTLSYEMEVVGTLNSSSSEIVIAYSNKANTYPPGGPAIQFSGKISSIRLSNRARSPDEIQHSATVGKKLLRERDD